MPACRVSSLVTSINRRTAIRTIAAGTFGAVVSTERPSRAESKQKGVTFGFGTYGMKTLSTERAINEIARIGFDAVELAVRPQWDSSLEKLKSARRPEIRKRLETAGLQLTALMAELRPAADDKQHNAHLETLRKVSELGHDLSPMQPPVVQTILGGGKWDQEKQRIAHRIADWASVAKQAETIVCIKPQRGGVMSRPSEAAWIIDQLDNTPWVRMVYDYSHYAFRQMPLEQTVQTALPITRHIAIKDTVRKGNGTTFVLPGDGGTIDYAKLIGGFYEGGYRHDICCEVSGAVWGQPGYDPIAAAETCYHNIAPVFEKIGVPRRSL